MPPPPPEEPGEATPRGKDIQSIPGEVNQDSFRESQPTRPPSRVAVEDVTYRMRAGVKLTWGVLGIITLFLGAVLASLWASRHPACTFLDTLGEPIRTSLTNDKARLETITMIFQQCETQRKAFYDFWLAMVEKVLLNVLLPVLTALLGYIFGTQQSAAQQE